MGSKAVNQINKVGCWNESGLQDVECLSSFPHFSSYRNQGYIELKKKGRDKIIQIFETKLT